MCHQSAGTVEKCVGRVQEVDVSTKRNGADGRGENTRLQLEYSCFDGWWLLTLHPQFNTLPMWVISVVLKEEQQKARTRLVEHFVTIAMKCRELNNFHAILGILGGLKVRVVYGNTLHRTVGGVGVLVLIYSHDWIVDRALQHTSVKRLTKTWQGVANRINTQLQVPILQRLLSLSTYNSQMKMQDLSSLMSIDDNWGNFRKALTNCGLPAMPYIGVLLKDLLFLEDGISGM